jgi:hypothetical protein
VCQSFGWKHGLHAKPHEAKGFYAATQSHPSPLITYEAEGAPARRFTAKVSNFEQSRPED